MNPREERESQVKPGDLEALPCKVLYFAVLEEITGGCDFWLTLELHPSNQRLPTSS